MPFPLAVRAVFLDLDGTLIDTAHDLTDAANAMLTGYGLAPYDIDAIRSFVGRGLPNLVQRCLDGRSSGAGASGVLPSHAEALARFRECYRVTNGRHATLYPGVLSGLQQLRAMRLPLGCVTNKAAAFTRPLMETTGIAAYFAEVVCGDTLPKSKPDPLPLLHLCERFGIAPNEAVLIGDSRNDIAAARAAGCPVFCVPYGYNEGVAVRAEDCDAIVPTLEAAARLLTPVQP